MGNFDFLRESLPALHEDCARAESYVTTDPRTACFYARRAVEAAVGHLYQVLALPEPYRDDLAARINADAFAAATGNAIKAKLNLVRRVANTAVHANAKIPVRTGEDVLREVFHVMVWTAFHHSPRPDVVPTSAQFDPQLAAKAAPLSRAELVALAKKFQEQDEAHARELAARDAAIAQHEAQIAELRAQIAAAQAAKTATDDHDYREAETRERFIDRDLAEAGWLLTEPRDREFEVTGMPTASGTGYVDYVLWGADGLPLAIVEAKRTTASPAVGQQQAKLYADCLEAMTGRRPVIYYTNGYERWLWDDAAGYPPRAVQGFATRDELELMVQRRHSRLPLVGTQIVADIAGRPYQQRAIRAVGEAFTVKRREALLVMATGAGKTRTVVALVDQLMRTGWAKRVLFLADRKALVRQAANAFTTHLPSATTVNLLEERDGDGRVFVSTYPTMLRLIDEVDGDGRRRFGPGHFDLVVIDEAHRSVYAKYGAIFEWFDSLLLGLTATPKDEVDRNTYRLFHLEDGVPTDSYSLDEAVADGFLVPPRGVSVGTKFLRQGIRYEDLSEEEKTEWDLLDWGEGDVPDEVGAEELNRFLFNEDTVDKVLATVMRDGHKVAGGDRLAKTIIFAKNRRHAEFISQRFDIQWPEHAGHFARTITHDDRYAQSLIESFSVAERAPHIAISVDMLDTGIDVPEVANLVFFTTVRSKTKFWQMIGRGTRLSPDLFGPGEDKQDFYVFDFCGNLEYFQQGLPGSEGSTRKSLTQRIVESRIDLALALEGADDAPLGRELRDALHAFVAGMNHDNVLVRPHREAVERFSDRPAWEGLTPEAADQARTLAGLPSAVLDTDEDAKRFDLVMLRCQLAVVGQDTASLDALRRTVQALASTLLTKTAIPAVAAQAVILEALAGDEWWQDVTLDMLETARRAVRDLVRFIERTSRNPVYTDFVDELGEATEIELTGATTGTDLERFIAKATAYLREHEDRLALQRLRRNKQLTTSDLAELESMLQSVGPVDISYAVESSGGLGLFVRSLVGMDRAAVQEEFSQFLDSGRYTAEQIRFIGMVIDELTTNGRVDPARLYESPYTDNAPTGPDYVFEPRDVDVLVEILHGFASHAAPGGAA